MVASRSAGRVKISQLDRAAQVEMWPDLVDAVAEALAHDPFDMTTVEQVEKQVRGGYVQVLLAHTDEGDVLGAAMLQMYRVRGKKVLHILTTTGVEVDRWLTELIAHCVDITQREGGAAVTMGGRPGWRPRLSQLGFKTESIQMRLEVENGEGIRVRGVGEFQPQRGVGESADRPDAVGVPGEPVGVSVRAG